ncbi:MAG: DUF2304 domain-containing protein [Bacteroidota bacterium]
MEIYQLLAPALALYYIYRLAVELKERKKFLFTNIVWLGFWSMIAVLGVVPHELSTQIAGWLGFASNINAIIFIALAFLIVLSFYLSNKLDKLERKMTELVRQLALDENKIRELERKRIIQQQKVKELAQDA